jgi:hypothetical protein
MRLVYREAKKFFTSKKKGEGVIPGAIMLALTIFVMYLLLTLFLNYYATIHAQEEVHVVARNYLLKMELNNCLEQSDIENLVSALSELGMTGIQLSGNFATDVSSGNVKVNAYPAEYSDEVYILIEGTLNVDTNVIRFLGMEIDLSKPTVNMYVLRKGVAVK